MRYARGMSTSPASPIEIARATLRERQTRDALRDKLSEVQTMAISAQRCAEDYAKLIALDGDALATLGIVPRVAISETGSAIAVEVDQCRPIVVRMSGDDPLYIFMDAKRQYGSTRDVFEAIARSAKDNESL